MKEENIVIGEKYKIKKDIWIFRRGEIVTVKELINSSSTKSEADVFVSTPWRKYSTRDGWVHPSALCKIKEG